MRLRARLTSGLPGYLAGAGWPHCRSARASHGAHAPATRRPRHQNGCEAEPGTCWGTLRANHLVDSHEQGVRTMERAGRATVEQQAQGSARTGGGHEVAALVVRKRADKLAYGRRICAGATLQTGRHYLLRSCTATCVSKACGRGEAAGVDRARELMEGDDEALPAGQPRALPG